MTGSWLDSLQATVAEYATAALAAGEEAGAALGAQLADALARVQALPDEAALAAADLTAALMGVFPAAPHDAASDRTAPIAPAGAGCDEPAGQGGLIGRTNGTHPLPQRWKVDPAGLARFIRAQHPEKPAEHAAARTRLPLETVKKILARETLGNGRTLLAFVCAYGPDVLVEALPGVSERWLEGARILHDQVRLNAELARARDAVRANAGRWTFCGIEFGGGA